MRLRTDVEVQKPLLPPEQRYFLRENLRLMLYGAQNALLQGSVTTYQQNVKSAARWVREYFDTTTQVVSATLAEIVGGVLTVSVSGTVTSGFAGSLLLTHNVPV